MLKKGKTTIWIKGIKRKYFNANLLGVFDGNLQSQMISLLLDDQEPKIGQWRKAPNLVQTLRRTEHFAKWVQKWEWSYRDNFSWTPHYKKGNARRKCNWGYLVWKNHVAWFDICIIFQLTKTLFVNSPVKMNSGTSKIDANQHLSEWRSHFFEATILTYFHVKKGVV